MTNAEMIKKLTEVKELKRMAEELETEIDAIMEEVKAEMGDTEQATFGPYKVTYKWVIQNRLDTTAIKKALPAEMLKPYMKETKTRPCKIS